MKGIFIAYNQAYNMEIADVLEQLGCRGFTMWNESMFLCKLVEEWPRGTLFSEMARI